MKMRVGYVSNSSSSSFIIAGEDPEMAGERVRAMAQALCEISGIEYAGQSEDIVDIDVDVVDGPEDIVAIADAVVDGPEDCGGQEATRDEEAGRPGNVVDLAAFFFARSLERLGESIVRSLKCFGESMGILGNLKKEQR